MIVAEKLCKRLGETLVLDGVSIAVPRNKVTAVIGPNGAGKSTFLSLVSRLMGMDAGSVTVDGLDIARTPSDQLARRLSILRQDNHMTARLTVRDLVSFGRYPYSKGRLTTDDKERIERALAWLHLTDLGTRYLDELSGGQRQRAFAAMVLCQDTDYVLLDEPLNNLDMKHARQMMQMLRRMCHELGKTVVIVLHDLTFASWYADHIIALKDGQVCRHGPTDEIMTPDVLETIYDMEIQVIDVCGHRTALHYG